MSRIISVHSFRGGTGKSNTTANIASLLALEGRRVGVIDTDIQSPGIHILFGLEGEDPEYSLNDYLWGMCEIENAAMDVTNRLDSETTGRLFLIPSSLKAGDIARILHDGYDVSILNEGFRRLDRELELDYLLIDTHPGLNEETLLSIALSDVLLVILRPDRQDFQGTGVTIEVARQLEVPEMKIIVNKIPVSMNCEDLKKKVEGIYSCEVAAVIPHSDDMMLLGSKDVFSLRYPEHELSGIYRNVARWLTGLGS